MKCEVYPLLFGGDINVYSVSRAFYEAYGIKCSAVGKYPSFPCWGSAIINYRAEPKVEEPETFFRIACEFADRHAGKPVLLIGCGDSYVKLIAEHKDRYPENVIAPYVSGEMINTLINKEKFYALCDQYGLDHPATFIHRKELGHDFELPFGAPYICKPSNGVEYWAHPFEGNDKVFILDSREKLDATLDKVYASGYTDSMIIQEFIPGDDSYMRVLTNYSDRNGKVKLMCLGHTLLEEHTPHGLGNHAAILLEENEELCLKIKAFLEEIGFVGFSNFDIKYDQRDGKFKLFEINCRQGRSNYYVTGGGYNVAKYFVEDRILEQELPFTLAANKALWTVVPLGVIYRFTPKKYHAEVRALVKAGKVTSPLVCRADRSLKRLYRVTRSRMSHYYKFWKYYKRPEE